jgi:two-component system chemotaxis response regulator CheY
MAKKILAVGNCSVDHGALARLVSGHFPAQLCRAQQINDALAQLRGDTFDLVLVNRVFHGIAQQGLDLIRQIKADPTLAATPVMLLSNYPQCQQEAVAAGAEPGFGKDHLHHAETREKLRPFLE